MHTKLYVLENDYSTYHVNGKKLAVSQCFYAAGTERLMGRLMGAENNELLEEKR